MGAILAPNSEEKLKKIRLFFNLKKRSPNKDDLFLFGHSKIQDLFRFELLIAIIIFRKGITYKKRVTIF